MASYTPSAQYPPPYSQSTPQFPDNRQSPPSYEQRYPASRTSSQTDCAQPYYGAVPPTPVIAELPAPLPPAPPTTTPQEQLTEDELLAHKLQQEEVEEAGRRSGSFLSARPSQPGLHAPSSPDLRHSYLGQGQSRPLRSHARSVSSLTPYGTDSFGHSQPALHAPSNPDLRHNYLGQEQSRQLRSHARSVSSLSPYGPNSSSQSPSSSATSPLAPWGPDSFAQPVSLNPSTLPEVVVGPPPAVFDDEYNPPANITLPSQLPEVVVGPRPVSSNGKPTAIPSPIMHPTAHLPPAPTDVASLSKYLEQHRQVPHPPQWILPPAVVTFYGAHVRAPKSSTWLDIPTSQEWRTVRFTEHLRKPIAPAYEFTFKTKGGTFRDPQRSWQMTPAPRKDKAKKVQEDWKYMLKMDSNNLKRKNEILQPAKGGSLITTYIHASNYDSLRFVGPDKRLYLWVSHLPVTAMHGSRYDTLRHALFVAKSGENDPLYGDIVADHAYWDGFVDYNEAHLRVECNGCGALPINGLRWKCKSCLDHNICETCRGSGISVKSSCSFTLINLPDEALHIRSSSVEPALVVATLQILKDWEMHTMRVEKGVDPRGFEFSEISARKGDLGRLRYWKARDFDKKGRIKEDGQVFGTLVKMKELTEVANAAGNRLGANAGGDSRGVSEDNSRVSTKSKDR